MPKKITPFLMYEGRAEEAMNFYVSVLNDSRIESIERYGPQGPGPEGSVKLATMSLAGQEVMCIDSPAKHAFTFTAAASLFVECESLAEIDALFAALSEGGQVMMPPGNYGFSKKFAWLSDKFGVSWQLNWP
jgi:predicted 3-demethylubiquinone-9 3-methyltransferase (glyoxalase superfamily)